MLSESLRVPYRADDAFGTILVGSVLAFFTPVLVAVWTVLLVASPWVGLAATPVVALPSLVLRGYLLAVVDSGIHDRPTVPSFVRWGTLVRRGGSSTLLSAVYLLPAAVLGGIAIGGWVAAAIQPPGFTESAQALVGVLILVAGFGLLLYGLVYLYVRPAARAVFASTGSLRAALGVRRVLRLAATGDYLTGWLIAMGLLTAAPTLLLPLVGIAVAVGYLSPAAALIILLVTILLGFYLGFVIRVSAAWATGRGGSTGLAEIYPASVRDTTAETGVLMTADSASAPSPKTEPSRPEADPAIQTGRTVGLNPAESQPPGKSDLPAVDSQSTPTEADGNGSVSDDDGESVDDESNQLRSDDDNDSRAANSVGADSDEPEAPDGDGETNNTDDHGFVWGVDDDQ